MLKNIVCEFNTFSMTTILYYSEKAIYKCLIYNLSLAKTIKSKYSKLNTNSLNLYITVQVDIDKMFAFIH